MKQSDTDLFIELIARSFCFMECRVFESEDKKNALDLIKAIFSYRDIPDKDQILIEHPELKDSKVFIELMWKHFDGLSQEALSDLVIEMIHEIY